MRRPSEMDLVSREQDKRGSSDRNDRVLQCHYGSQRDGMDIYTGRDLEKDIEAKPRSC